MENTNKTYDLKVEKVIAKSPAEVFRSLSEGRLFMNCSADQELMKIDFKVGGKYSLDFLAAHMKNTGEFLEIVPNQKIVFTWCQDYDSNPTPDTTVSIELKDEGGKTALTLTHTGFSDLESKDAHQGGWNGGLEDLSQEMVNGKLRFMREIPKPLGELYDFCKSPDSVFSKLGKIVESEPNLKLTFALKPEAGLETKLTLKFEEEDEKSAWIELIHEGLVSEAQQKNQRKVWESFFKKMI